MNKTNDMGSPKEEYISQTTMLAYASVQDQWWWNAQDHCPRFDPTEKRDREAGLNEGKGGMRAISNRDDGARAGGFVQGVNDPHVGDGVFYAPSERIARAASAHEVFDFKRIGIGRRHVDHFLAIAPAQ